MAETFKCAHCGKEFPIKNGYYNYPVHLFVFNAMTQF